MTPPLTANSITDNVFDSGELSVIICAKTIVKKIVVTLHERNQTKN